MIALVLLWGAAPAGAQPLVGPPAPPEVQPDKPADPCVEPDDDAAIVIVCAPKLSPLERELDAERRRDPMKDNAWALMRVMGLGDTGIHSCSNVGASGMSGCEVRSIRRSSREGRTVSVFGDIEIDLFGRNRR